MEGEPMHHQPTEADPGWQSGDTFGGEEMSLVTASGTDAAFEELPPELKGFSDEIDRLARSMAGDLGATTEQTV